MLAPLFDRFAKPEPKQLRPHQDKDMESRPGEEWRPVCGYEDDYEVSSHGRVRSVAREVSFSWKGRVATRSLPGKIKAQTEDPGQYAYGRLQVKLSSSGKSRTHLVHRLVARAFIGECPIGCQVAHGDGDTKNNALWNLRYATPMENSRDKDAHGTHARGERAGGAKLSQADVMEMLGHRANGTSQTAIAKAYGVSEAQVSRIVNGTRWVHIHA